MVEKIMVLCNEAVGGVPGRDSGGRKNININYHYKSGIAITIPAPQKNSSPTPTFALDLFVFNDPRWAACWRL
jgi:hypothetical protein